ncbi:MAG: polyketide synthase, partial [Verrucomicrobiota bacterium]
HFKLKLPSSVVFEYHNLDDLAAHIEREGPEPVLETPPLTPSAPQPVSTPVREDEVVIIGMACRCAGANNPDEFWGLVSQGRSAVRAVDDPEWLDFFQRHSESPVPACYGAMEGIDVFDPAFFSISPREAATMAPTQRVFMEEAYKALEDAGYTRAKLQNRQVGTYVGMMAGTSGNGDGTNFSMVGSEASIAAARMAYYLDLKGPALAINTACSSSLVAVDLARQALRNRSIDLAMAGGVTMYTDPASFLVMNDAGMLSATGTCRPFDNAADGIVVGDGAGVVILKRREEAERDGDRIYGVIRGSGTNQDGRTSGITVPSFMSQCQLEETVYRDSRVSPRDIQYVETHGTGTRLGDPVEMHALSHA